MKVLEICAESKRGVDKRRMMQRSLSITVPSMSQATARSFISLPFRDVFNWSRDYTPLTGSSEKRSGLSPSWYCLATGEATANCGAPAQTRTTGVTSGTEAAT